MSATTKTTAANLIAEFDADRASQKARRGAADRSAQQNVQGARGISSAIKVGFGLAVLIVVVAVVI